MVYRSRANYLAPKDPRMPKVPHGTVYVVINSIRCNLVD